MHFRSIQKPKEVRETESVFWIANKSHIPFQTDFCDTLKQSNSDVTAEPTVSRLIQTTVKFFSHAGMLQWVFQATIQKDQQQINWLQKKRP